MKIPVEAKTINNVTGNLQTIDWNNQAKQWKHLQGIDFPKIDTNNKVDLLIGLDYSELHRSLYEVYGDKGEPIARLTPLGWTCVGAVEEKVGDLSNTRTFFAKEKCDCVSLERFCETETITVQNPVRRSKIQDFI